MKILSALITLALLILGSSCQPGPSNPQASPTVSSAPAKALTITSETKNPDLPQILIPGLELKVFAGNGKAGYQDGKALEAAFNEPLGMAKDENGNIYVAEYKGYRVRKIDTAGQVSTLAGNGKRSEKDITGPFATAEFFGPKTLVYLNPNKLLLYDQVRIFSLDLINSNVNMLVFKTESSVIETSDTSSSQPSLNIQLFKEFQGKIYVGFSQEIWQMVQKDNQYVLSRYAGSATASPRVGYIDDPTRFFKDGPPNDSVFYGPQDMDFDNEGNMYVADSRNHRIRKIAAGTREVSTISGYGTPDPTKSIAGELLGGFKDGSLQEAIFNDPYSIAVLNKDTFVVNDLGNKALRLISQGMVRTLVRNLDCGGFLKDGNKLYLTDRKNHQIYTLDLSNLEKLKTAILKQEKQS